MLALNPILQRYQDGEDMEAFFAQKRNAQQKLSALGVSFHDRLLALLLLHSMPESFAAAKSTLTHFHRDTLTFESVADALVSEYILRQAATAASSEHGGDGESENAMYAAGNLGSERTNNKAAAKSADRNSKCTNTHCTERNHSKDSCWARMGYPVGHRLNKTPGGADSQQQRPTTGKAKQAYVASDNSRLGRTSLSSSYQKRDSIAPTRQLCFHTLSATVCTRHLEALNSNSSSDPAQATPSRPTW